MVKVKMFESQTHVDREAMDMPALDADGFMEVVESRRSVRVFAKDPVPEEVVNACVRAAQLAPNSSNLQTWEIHHVQQEDKKAALVKACLGQPAASTAAELFVFVARPDMWKRNNAWTLAEFERRGNMPERAHQYFKKITKIAYTQGLFAWVKAVWFPLRGLNKPTPREPIGWNDMKVWSQKSTALAAAHFMLAMRAHGFDTCPMEGMDSRRIKALLNVLKGLPQIQEANPNMHPLVCGRNMGIWLLGLKERTGEEERYETYKTFVLDILERTDEIWPRWSNQACYLAFNLSDWVTLGGDLELVSACANRIEAFRAKQDWYHRSQDIEHVLDIRMTWHCLLLGDWHMARLLLVALPWDSFNSMESRTLSIWYHAAHLVLGIEEPQVHRNAFNHYVAMTGYRGFGRRIEAIMQALIESQTK